MEKRIIAYGDGKTGYLEGDTLVKAFDSEYSKADVLNEALNHAMIEQTGLKVPLLLVVQERGEEWVIIKKYIPGRTFDEVLSSEPEKTDEYMELFVKTQKLIHSKRAPLLRRQWDRLSDKISASSLEATQRFSLLERIREMPRMKKVCHGDFNPSNVILTDGGDVYVIDWSHATQGNAAADAALTYLLFVLDGKNELAEKYLNVFCSSGTTKKEYIIKWLPIVAAAQSCKEQGERLELLLKIASDEIIGLPIKEKE